VVSDRRDHGTYLLQTRATYVLSNDVPHAENKRHPLTSMSGCTHFPEINESPLNVDQHQLHAHPIAYIQALEALQHLALNRNVEQPGSHALIRRTRKDRIKLLADFRFKQQRGGRFRRPRRQ